METKRSFEELDLAFKSLGKAIIELLPDIHKAARFLNNLIKSVVAE